MSELLTSLENINYDKSVSKEDLVEDIRNCVIDNGYTIVESNDQKPWGAYLKLDNKEADSFIADLFPGLNPTDARLGDEKAELSPKLLIVSPSQRLSWQYHNRRAELWTFLTEGHLNKSPDDKESEVVDINRGELIQFTPLERHRLIGNVAFYTLVAEIWQHIDLNNLSSEDDIVRLSDDYSRN